jgi:phosphonate transport system substrate-binding protein
LPTRFPWVVLVVLAGCSRDGATGYTPVYGASPGREPVVYRFAVHPLHNPQRLVEVYGPIVALINRNLNGATLKLEASRSYEEFERRLADRSLDFALPNPSQTLAALGSGYRIVGKMGDDDRFRGILLVRKDSGIREVADLKGKVVSFPAPTALAAAMMPIFFLHTNGLDANRDIQRRFTGSQESSIMSAYLRDSAAAATWPVPWEAFQRRSPDVAAELEVRWTTEPLVNNAFIARDDLPAELVGQVTAVLLSLHTHEEGRRVLAGVPLSRFEPADEATYEPVRKFLEAYRAAIR